MRAATPDAPRRNLPETVIGAAVMLLLALVAVSSLLTRSPPRAVVHRSTTLPRLPYEPLLTLQSPTEPGTPLGVELRTEGTLAVRAECIGRGVLTVSLAATPLLAVDCRRGIVRTAEEQVDTTRRDDTERLFLVAQAGDSSYGTRWRVTVRQLSGGSGGGHAPL